MLRFVLHTVITSIDSFKFQLWLNRQADFTSNYGAIILYTFQLGHFVTGFLEPRYMPWWTALLARHGIQQSGHSLSHLQLVDFIGSACRLLRDSFAHLNGNRHGCTEGPPLDIVGFQSNRIQRPKRCIGLRLSRPESYLRNLRTVRFGAHRLHDRRLG